jgi:hypothetical protein
MMARIGRVLASGSVASVLSSVAAMIASRAQAGRAAAALNGPSQWIWGRFSRQPRRADARRTLAGYVIHHASSLLWATLFESAAAREVLPARGARAAAVAALAATVDYAIVPRRFSPGLERHISPPSIAATYVAFAAGLALASSLHGDARTGVKPHRRSARGRSRRDR